MNKGMAVVIVLVGVIVATAIIGWVLLVVSEARRDIEDGVLMPHSGLNGVLYRHAVRVYTKQRVRDEVRRNQMEKK